MSNPEPHPVSSPSKDRSMTATPTPLRELRNFREETFAEARQQLVNVLKAQKSWLTGYAEAYVDDFVDLARDALSARDEAGAVECAHERSYGAPWRCAKCGYRMDDATPSASGEADIDAEVQAYRQFHLSADLLLIGNNALDIDREGSYDAAIENTLNAIRRLAAAPSPASRARPEAQGGSCPHCGAPCRKEVLMRGGDNGWGDDASRTVYRYVPPADRAPGEVGEAEPFAAMLDRLAGDEPSAAVATIYREAATLIRRLAAVAPAGMDGWQPIATAPKDGVTEILLHGYGNTFIGVRPLGCPDDAAADLLGIASYPTHWQPLPTPPATAGEE